MKGVALNKKLPPSFYRGVRMVLQPLFTRCSPDTDPTLARKITGELLVNDGPRVFLAQARHP